MISLTQESAVVLCHYMKQESPAPNFVRFGVKAGGCSGFTYTIDFDSQPRKFDLEFESFGVPLLVDKKSHLFIKNNGLVGVNTTAPAYTLDITGDIRATGTVYGATKSFDIEHEGKEGYR